MAPQSRLRSTSRKNAPLSPPKAPSPTVAANASTQNGRRTRSASHDITAAQRELQNVTTTLPAVNEDDEDLLSAQTRNGLLDALDRDAIIDNLFDLYRHSSSLISLLEDVSDGQLREMCEAVAQPAARVHKRFQTQAKHLLLSRENYGIGQDGTNLDFIQPDLILRKIWGIADADAIPDGPWRPDAVLYIANLALQVVNVLNPSVEVRRSYLGDMFINFPRQFIDLHYFQPSSKTYRGLCDLLVEMLTQVYLQKVEIDRNHKDFDPEKILTSVFFDETGQVKGSSHRPSRLKALNRCEVIRGHFRRDPTNDIDFDGLKDHFPWSDFAVRTVRWTQAVEDELEEIVNSTGGIDKLVDFLEAGNFDADPVQIGQERTTENDKREQSSEDRGSRVGPAQVGVQGDAGATTGRVIGRDPDDRGDGLEADELNNASMRPMLAARIPAAGATSTKQTLRSNMERLKALKAQYAPRAPGVDVAVAVAAGADTQSDSDSHPEILQSPTPAISDDYRIAGIGDDEVPGADDDADRIQDDGQGDGPDEEILPTQQTKELLETVRRQRQQSNKENVQGTPKKASFLDRQQGAERLQWDDEFPDAGEIHRPRRPSPKRTIQQVDSGSDEDDDFETDTRTAKRPRVVVEKGEAASSTRPRPQGAEDDEEERDGGYRKQARSLPSHPRGGPSRPGHRERMASLEPPRVTILSSSQPERSSNQRSSSSRAPLQSIPSGSRGLPSSSAPARSARTNNVSSNPPTRHIPPSHQEEASTRIPSASQEPPSTQAQRVNQQAKDMVRMARELQQNRRPAQMRRAYSPEEVDRLLDMIALYGTQWARILREDNAHPDGPMLQGRTQVQLKDKARNIKLDMLKAGTPLPYGFEFVSVGNKKIEELRLLGIDYFEGTDGARYTGRRDGHDDDIGD
ncbi:hypothetical protein, variant [Phialophora macrospora]|uniref:Myb-like domain-containing protein n=1 Tax=Phialophora macrospora TaxID=1851006 RepID=A0A0D2D6V3_9EURO|nr:hypothetical protein, variant [Phialophora macrospora]